MMILSVPMPHSGFDEEDYFAGCAHPHRVGSGSFFFNGGDLNIELNLETGDEDLQGLDDIDWYGIYGPEWRGRDHV